MPQSYEEGIDGKIYGLGRDGKKYHLNPKAISESTRQSRNTGDSSQSSKFKLVTVRRLTQSTVSQAKESLERQQKLLEEVALRTGKPSPFPARIPVNEDDLKNTYAVYVDEDIYGRTQPVYTFTSPSAKVKAFITANGRGKEDYSVHIAHIVSKETLKDENVKLNWRIITIDNRLNSNLPVYYFLESQSEELPACFESNFDIDSLNYMGGGQWTAVAIDDKDRIAVKAPVKKSEASKYFPTNKRWGGKVLSIVSFSLTPSYVMTWCRDTLKVKYRTRTCSHKTDIGFLKNEGVVLARRKYSYSLELPQRVESSINNNIEVLHQENAVGEAVFVSNLNSPEVPGLDIFPDYGTDSARVSIQSYRQSTNIIRPLVSEYSDSYYRVKAVRQGLNYACVVASSNNMSHYIRLFVGEALGSIYHGFETKIEQGKRGFQYGEDYNLWWTYGKITAFYPTNDGMIYYRSKTAEARGESSLIPTGETLYDRGELKLSDYPNATETTWPARANPQTGFFGLKEGEATWLMEYSNPPILGHEGSYYYHINPVLPDIDDTKSQSQGDFNAFGDNIQQLNTLRNLYGQLQGGLGGGTTTSLHIGRVRKASSASDTLPILSPSPSQKEDILDIPERYPAGFWEAQIFDEVVNSDNSINMTTYNSKGDVKRTSTS